MCSRPGTMLAPPADKIPPRNRVRRLSGGGIDQLLLPLPASPAGESRSAVEGAAAHDNQNYRSPPRDIGERHRSFLLLHAAAVLLRIFAERSQLLFVMCNSYLHTAAVQDHGEMLPPPRIGRPRRDATKPFTAPLAARVPSSLAHLQVGE